MNLKTTHRLIIIMRLIIIIIIILTGVFTVLAEGKDPETGAISQRVPGDGLGVFCNIKVDCWLIEGDKKIKKLKYDDWDVAKKNYLDGSFTCPGKLVKRATMSAYLWNIRYNEWIYGMACVVPKSQLPS